MTLVLILPAWLILLALVAGLCMAARVGDNACPNAARAVAPVDDLLEDAIEFRRPVGERGAGPGVHVSAGNLAA